MTYVPAAYVHDKKTIHHAPVAAVAMGAVVVLTGGTAGYFVCIAKHAIAAGARGEVAANGVFDVDKASAAEFTAGQTVYWDPIALNFTTIDEDNVEAGRAIGTYGAGTIRARIRLRGASVAAIANNEV